ncbi:MAG TPA: DNA gyrase inhibitor YacG [Caulobacteraceae bacterium]|nr:DNA gyrase inhibitor YacG [Caulobacteraceae bacterium]
MTTAKCPICGRPPEAKFRPFCSKRCADVDLARWFSGAYAIPGAPAHEEEDVPPAEEE